MLEVSDDIFVTINYVEHVHAFKQSVLRPTGVSPYTNERNN